MVKVPGTWRERLGLHAEGCPGVDGEASPEKRRRSRSGMKYITPPMTGESLLNPSFNCHFTWRFTPLPTHLEGTELHDSLSKQTHRPDSAALDFILNTKENPRQCSARFQVLQSPSSL